MNLDWKARLWLSTGARKVKKMDGFKRWAPFVGSVITVVCALLKALGYNDEADLVLRVVAYFLPGVSTEEQALATTAVVSVVGLSRQLYSRVQKARGKSDVVTIPIR